METTARRYNPIFGFIKFVKRRGTARPHKERRRKASCKYKTLEREKVAGLLLKIQSPGRCFSDSGALINWFTRPA